MKKLHEIVKEKDGKQNELSELIKNFEKAKSNLQRQIESLKELEKLAVENKDIEKIQIARGIILVSGNPYGKTSDVTKFGNPTIAECAIIDIANDCPHLRRMYFGNKVYEAFYQRCDCEYGYGPSHGGIVDRIELRDLKRKLSDDEKDACIYFLKNYSKIQAIKSVAVA